MDWLRDARVKAEPTPTPGADAGERLYVRTVARAGRSARRWRGCLKKLHSPDRLFRPSPSPAPAPTSPAQASTTDKTRRAHPHKLSHTHTRVAHWPGAEKSPARRAGGRTAGPQGDTSGDTTGRTVPRMRVYREKGACVHVTHSLPLPLPSPYFPPAHCSQRTPVTTADHRILRRFIPRSSKRKSHPQEHASHSQSVNQYHLRP